MPPEFNRMSPLFMKHPTVKTRTVALILAAAVLLVLIVVAILNFGLFRRGVVIETYIDETVQGLDVGSALYFRGVRIGWVTDIALVEDYYPDVDSAHSRYVLVRMEVTSAKGKVSKAQMRQRVDAWISDGMRVRHTSQGLLGFAFMEADFADEQVPSPLQISWTPEVPYVPSSPTQLSGLASSVASIASELESANISQVVGEVQELVSRLETALEKVDLHEVSDQLRDSLAGVERSIDVIGEFPSDPLAQELSSRAYEAFDQIKVVLKDASGVIAGVDGKLNDLEVGEALDQLRDVATRIEAMMRRVEESYLHKDRQIDLILSDLRAMSASFREMGQLLSQYPSLAAFGQPPPSSDVYTDE